MPVLRDAFDQERPERPTPPVHPDLIATARYRDTLRKHIEKGQNVSAALALIDRCFKEVFSRVTEALPPSAIQTRAEFKNVDD